MKRICLFVLAAFITTAGLVACKKKPAPEKKQDVRKKAQKAPAKKREEKRAPAKATFGGKYNFLNKKSAENMKAAAAKLPKKKAKMAAFVIGMIGLMKITFDFQDKGVLAVTETKPSLFGKKKKPKISNHKGTWKKEGDKISANWEEKRGKRTRKTSMSCAIKGNTLECEPVEKDAKKKPPFKLVYFFQKG